MHMFQELVYLHRLGEPATKVAEVLHLDPKTERKYRGRIAAAGLLKGGANSLPSFDVLRQAICRPPSRQPPQERSSVGKYHDFIKGRHDKGHGPTVIFGLLEQDVPGFDGSLSAVKRYCLALKKREGVKANDVVIPVHTGPGEQAQVDFGYIGKVRDPKSGLLRKCWVFVMVLGFSRMLFAKAVFSQDIDHWLRCHQEAFAYFGGVPLRVVPDNTKVAVIKAAFKADEVGILNRAYRDQARHFGFMVDPTPAFSPEKKGKVESGVKYVNRFLKRIAPGLNIDELNARLRIWLDTKANMRLHGTTQQRPKEMFESEEAQHMLPLTMGPYASTRWHRVKVGTNAHCCVGKRFYSVPWKHIGRDAMVAISGASMAFYVDDIFVAQHSSEGSTPWSTRPSHLPEERRELADRDPATWMARAAAIGPESAALVQEVRDSDQVLCTVRRMQSIVRSLEKLTTSRAESVARHAALYACYDPRLVRHIIAKGSDLSPKPVSNIVHTQWLSTPAFARQADAYACEGVTHGDA